MDFSRKPKVARLAAGDIVRLVSPASTPSEDDVDICVKYLKRLGLKPQVGPHALDRLGYLAGRDEDRLSDLNDAIRDPSVRAVIATRGGKGAYRIADGIDFAAMRANPKVLIGFSEITILHLSIWQQCAVPGIHGAAWNPIQSGETSSKSFERVISSIEDTIVHSNDTEPSASLTTSGKVRGALIGGNLDMIATAAGWALPSLNGAILLIEDVEKGLGHIDRTLTRLIKSGCLAGVAGVAVGQFSKFAPSKGLTVIDVLRDRLGVLGVPILGGLPLGHGPDALAIPIGTEATLDADNKALTITSAFT
ncbi:peptidase S66 family LD-carboxypeptidase A domain-containing protein (plasmid) [Rhizobium etli]|uniref:Peptidase S66 family LD-carboxypeptidase A domain-containing protein n=1 Tax=Rhizobium etli TaxID=29449 RepID=A0AAN1BMG7_RHIET|nr:peptidase S66 family LD-carboxypeptidase A domain-containing protein [Rhizobium etli]